MGTEGSSCVSCPNLPWEDREQAGRSAGPEQDRSLRAHAGGAVGPGYVRDGPRVMLGKERKGNKQRDSGLALWVVHISALPRTLNCGVSGKWRCAM